MAANRWMLEGSIAPEALCRCGHAASGHLHGKSCGYSDPTTFKFCKCEMFKGFQVNQNQTGDEMSKEKKQRKKSEGRTPTLAPYTDTLAGKTIYMNHDGKEHTATVLTSGAIRMGEKDFTSPSSAAGAILGKNKKGKQLQADGWRCWRFNKDGERVELNVLRGKDSPLKAAAAPKREKKAKVAKSSSLKPHKPRAARKSKASKANGAETASTSAAQQEASA
jgi:hypothetical protein